VLDYYAYSKASLSRTPNDLEKNFKISEV